MVPAKQLCIGACVYVERRFIQYEKKYYLMTFLFIFFSLLAD